MKIVLVAGGTGGHIYPAIAVAQEIKKIFSFADICFISKKKGKEVEIIKKESLKQNEISLAPPGINPLFIFKIFISFFQSLHLLHRIKPEIIFALGNYLSVPVVLAGWLLKIPIVLHEQNVIPGRAIKFLSRFAQKIFVSFPETEKYFTWKKVIFTGNPVREIDDKPDEEILSLTKNGRKIIVIFGGSLGARTINEAVIASREMFSQMEDYYLIHISGERDYSYVKDKVKNYHNYKIFPYCHNLLNIMKAADVVVSRAGATTLAEITYLGKPSILIPYPFAVANHQEFNARKLEEEGAAMVIKDKNLSGEKLFSVVQEILSDEEKRKKMSLASYSLGVRNAKDKIIQEILEIVGKHQDKP